MFVLQYELNRICNTCLTVFANLFENASVHGEEPIAFCRTCTRQMQRIRILQADVHQVCGIRLNLICHLDINARTDNPIQDLLAMPRNGIVKSLPTQHVTPSIFHLAGTHHGLNAQLRLRFKTDAQLPLTVKRAIVAAVIEIDSHMPCHTTLIITSSMMARLYQNPAIAVNANTGLTPRQSNRLLCAPFEPALRLRLGNERTASGRRPNVSTESSKRLNGDAAFSPLSHRVLSVERFRSLR